MGSRLKGGIGHAKAEYKKQDEPGSRQELGGHATLQHRSYKGHHAYGGYTAGEQQLAGLLGRETQQVLTKYGENKHGAV